MQEIRKSAQNFCRKAWKQENTGSSKFDFKDNIKLDLIGRG
jgi:hypothetical protein